MSLALLPAPREATAAEIDGVVFPEYREWDGEALRLHGLGTLRHRRVFKGYSAALYLGEGVRTEEVLGDVPRRLEIEYFWSIPARFFARATREGIARNVDRETLARLEEPIRALNAMYRDVRPGDRYALTYLPGVGTELSLDDERVGLVEGVEFSSALFSIWLGEAPLDESLRDRLLARR